MTDKWSEDLNALVITQVNTFHKYRNCKVKAAAHLKGSRTVVPPIPEVEDSVATRSQTTQFVLYSPGCPACNQTVIALPNHQIHLLNRRGEFFTCTHRAIISRWERLSDAAPKVRQESSGIPNFTYASTIKTNCGVCDTCTREPCGACRPCRKGRHSMLCKTKTCPVGIPVQPHYSDPHGSSIGSTISGRNRLANDLASLRAFRTAAEDSLEKLRNYLIISEPSKQGTHPLLSPEVLQEDLEELDEEVAIIEQDMEEALEVQTRLDSLRDDLQAN